MKEYNTDNLIVKTIDGHGGSEVYLVNSYNYSQVKNDILKKHKNDRDRQAGKDVGDQRHAGSHFGVLAQRTGNDNGIQTQRHSKRADSAGSKGFLHREYTHCPKKKQRKDDQPQNGN